MGRSSRRRGPARGRRRSRPGRACELYRRHEPWLSSRLSYRCADPSVVEEVVQDTFVAIWKSASRYAGTGAVAAWIWGIGYRQLLHALRPRRSLVERLLAQRSAESISAEEQMLATIEHGDLGVALSRLSPNCAQWFRQRCSTGLPVEKPATSWAFQGHGQARMMRARHELREALT